MLEKRITTKSSQETFDFAKQLGEAIDFPLIVFLQGQMGAGKTLFSKGFVAGMGLLDEVTSPTYTIVNEYGNPPRVFHFDLYRLQDPDELYEMGFEDYLSQGCTLLLEWPDLVLEDNLEPRLEIRFESCFDSPDDREIILKTDNEKVAQRLNSIDKKIVN
ncbi:tRNA (adenosine(37)-N6)-threonylcarbamoyltransferase complex ATPase subunit type 1 TsaE [Acetobacterium wieringae]|uniref:tRNA threonylcarbamoyladenosine biosynthesis protein TsaE n=1 Tax=Acetobacterium wieringae TaxID=52694 RepID=A0ABY6HG00_9FIRM|nr:tRNA (adenosine(37)-N6)-threonylcarbamoyltransferase complex ATPase subunit type 1 TsaE [Acetobacterium wieringae]UYO63415.1 tRNA (adenosine(37)-N6)-threonylcarbamoyltransferase complex ATPase subunit type 1 TsaE [Acetobacterium wieringae]VUZ23955.1 tRNA threonylcarbamoyladenosine biosynthesis protein TsaE [Acetobacterium wieringae]